MTSHKTPKARDPGEGVWQRPRPVSTPIHVSVDMLGGDSAGGGGDGSDFAEAAQRIEELVAMGRTYLRAITNLARLLREPDAAPKLPDQL